MLMLVNWGVQYKRLLIFLDQGKTLYSSSIVPAKILSDSDKWFCPQSAIAHSALVAAVRATRLHFFAAPNDPKLAQDESFLLSVGREPLTKHGVSERSYIRPPPLA